MNDIFFDTNLSKELENPTKPAYREFLNWLFTEGALVMSNKLEHEYIRGNQNLFAVIHKLTISGRLNRITNQQLQSFIFPKRLENKFLSNNEDRVHIKSIILSNRKLGIIGDTNLLTDVNSLPKYEKIKPWAEDSPEKINYK